MGLGKGEGRIGRIGLGDLCVGCGGLDRWGRGVVEERCRDSGDLGFVGVNHLCGFCGTYCVPKM